ncbi:MAG: mechanosensitive ion channel [Verrucomicrobia bacterium]|nr:mechanosensitive ion channel [Verrucomicrobiota bacterium]
MDLSLVFCVAVFADLVALRLIPVRRRIVRFVCRSIFFAFETVLIVLLVGSPLRPVFRPQDLPREFWLQILACCWWGLAARELISVLALPTAIRKTAVENKLLSDIIAASIYVCSALAMMGFVLGLSLQGVLATSGVIAIVLGLALQNTLGDVFSGISLSIEKPYRIGDEILLEGGAEGEVVEMNWRSTHLRNGANDIVVIPNSAIAKLRIQNHSAGTRRSNGSLTVAVDSRNEPELVLEILKQSAMTCPSILEIPTPSADVTEIKGDRMTYAIYFSTSSISAAGSARSQIITQLYKRVRPVVAQEISAASMRLRTPIDSTPIFLFPENEVLHHLPLLEPLSEAEKAKMNAKVIRHHFQAGDQLLAQGMEVDSAHFIFSGVVQALRQLEDGRVLQVRRLGPGDLFGDISLLTGLQSPGTLTALTSGLLLELRSEDLKPILESRPELVESLSRSAINVQQFVAMFEKAADQPAPIEQMDLLSRIKKFFRLDVS